MASLDRLHLKVSAYKLLDQILMLGLNNFRGGCNEIKKN